MPVEARIDLLKSNILHCIKDLLKFDVVEIRLMDQKTQQLIPLLEVGMDVEATHRDLYAREANNGVTGFVAYTGKSYLCEDTAHDPLYLTGAQGAKSSLTVPLKLHNEVIGTFNVESPQPHAFTDADLQFLQIFLPRRGDVAEHAAASGRSADERGAREHRGNSPASRGAD